MNNQTIVLSRHGDEIAPSSHEPRIPEEPERDQGHEEEKYATLVEAHNANLLQALLDDAPHSTR